MLDSQTLQVEPTPPWSPAAPARALFVVPTRSGEGFQARIRGHVLELADPDSPFALAPTPDDLLIVSLASEAAWLARRFLGSRGLEAHVGVSAGERPATSPEVDVTVTVESVAAELAGPLADELESRFAMRRLDGLVRLRVTVE
jgi:hypothetical protein